MIENFVQIQICTSSLQEQQDLSVHSWQKRWLLADTGFTVLIPSTIIMISISKKPGWKNAASLSLNTAGKYDLWHYRAIYSGRWICATKHNWTKSWPTIISTVWSIWQPRQESATVWRIRKLTSKAISAVSWTCLKAVATTIALAWSMPLPLRYMAIHKMYRSTRLNKSITP